MASTTEWRDIEAAYLTVPVDKRDHVQGPDGAPVTLVEYGDYECPYCGQAYPIIKKIQTNTRDELRFVFRNFPLAQVHPHAQQAAEAAETAGAQNMFWEMHDRLYEHQSELGHEDLKKHASALGLDVSVFEHELSGHVHASRIREDFMSGVRSGVNGTPTFYINGKRYDDSWDEETLMASIRQVISFSQRGNVRPNRRASRSEVKKTKK